RRPRLRELAPRWRRRRAPLVLARGAWANADAARAPRGDRALWLDRRGQRSAEPLRPAARTPLGHGALPEGAGRDLLLCPEPRSTGPPGGRGGPCGSRCGPWGYVVPRQGDRLLQLPPRRRRVDRSREPRRPELDAVRRDGEVRHALAPLHRPHGAVFPRWALPNADRAAQGRGRDHGAHQAPVRRRAAGSLRLSVDALRGATSRAR